MSRQYKRDYTLNIVTTDGDERTIKNLRVNFEITKSILSFPNICKLVIYNPNGDTLMQLRSKYTKLFLNAGYAGHSCLLFKGEIRNVFQGHAGVDSMVTVYAGDGERDWQNATINKTFAKNVSVDDAIMEVIKTFKSTDIGSINGLPDSTVKLRGQTYSGSSKDVLNDLAKEYKFNWSIQDEVIIITPVDAPTISDEAVIINSTTGMLGSPTLTETGANVTTLLNTDLLPNRAFKIESSNADAQLGNLFFRNAKKTTAEGFYKVQEVTFKGDVLKNDWTSTVKGISIK